MADRCLGGPGYAAHSASQSMNILAPSPRRGGHAEAVGYARARARLERRGQPDSTYSRCLNSLGTSRDVARVFASGTGARGRGRAGAPSALICSNPHLPLAPVAGSSPEHADMLAFPGGRALKDGFCRLGKDELNTGAWENAPVEVYRARQAHLPLRAVRGTRSARSTALGALLAGADGSPEAILN